MFSGSASHLAQKNHYLQRILMRAPSVNLLKLALFCSRTPPINRGHTHCAFGESQTWTTWKQWKYEQTMNIHEQKEIYMQTLEKIEK